MGIWEDKKYSTFIGYGIGQYYEKTKVELAKIVKLDYLCDRKWEEKDEKEYDSIALIKRKEINKLEGALLIVFTGNSWIYESIKRDLDKLGADYVHVDEIIGINGDLNGRMLKEKFPDGVYEDRRGNKIYFDQSLSDKLTVLFQGSGNTLRVGKNVSVGNLYIRFGNNGICSIGDNTEIIGAVFHVAYAEMRIGEDCLFSTQVVLRTHDAHHIFDVDTRKRLNYAKDIVVENHVWIAYRAILLGGAKIGTGSVVGANAVTSSQFKDHTVIAGSPAKVIRENICWSKDDTAYFDHSCLEECIFQE